MGKYIEQAGSYNHGIKMLKGNLEETVSELDEVNKLLLLNESSNDALTYYVDKFNKDILEEIRNLILKCNNVSFSIYQKAKELDEREIVEQTNESNTNKIIDTNTIVRPMGITRKFGGFYE